MSSLIPKEGGRKPRTRGSHADQGSPRARQQGSGLKCVATFAVAAAADGLQFAFPPFWIPVSIVTALIFFALWGWRWEVLCVLVPELAPGIDLFPSWVAIAIYLTGRDAGGTSIYKDSLRGESLPDNLRQKDPTDGTKPGL